MTPAAIIHEAARRGSLFALRNRPSIPWPAWCALPEA